MSSIYRKGRDGYFYYQTYLRNPKTGKVDKKVFHSLKTKDREEAEKKKIEYDLKYSKKGNKINVKYLIILPLFFLLYLFLSKNLKSTMTPNLNSNLATAIDSTKISIKYSEIQGKDINTNKERINQTNSIDSSFAYYASTELKIAEKEDQYLETPSITPSYLIQRTEVLSSSFDQAKIFVTVQEQYSNDIIQNICEDIRLNNENFSNIIICVYLDNDIGISIAKGLKGKFSAYEESKSWLAMYSFNPVEGAFYNDNPSEYLNQQ